ncbi:hypothetical protein Fleli_1641 [Bernardetia litoralis DSM 6794]|uniref:Outer membrane protein beta-barrel domain-containing protein n=1 Tax=Bernardetia litoralis (strain ATCC 23117 / DSM 6794 / NBRC 15988 / NCIMB 1366 / Fx l1 / Sio-4) TaxID=880071 RepID=I4AJC0_BERLS|nr:hypothetical protein [Bernardetia litoralis]AFM04055.1 hypothetical protein Fleli_1641 [Bernardetia litoralis DSM 6794]
MKRILFFIFIFTFFQKVTYGQNFSIQSIQFGYRFYDMSPVGNNPYTISNQLKDPEAYQEMINQYETNGFTGAAGILIPKQYYINVELTGNQKSKFWQKHSLQTGFFIGSQLSQRMSIKNWRFTSDSSLIQEYYFMTKKQRFVGANFGLRRKVNLFRNTKFLIGLEAEGRMMIQHDYTQQLESRGGGITVEDLPSFKGKLTTQGHLMLPFGFEYKYKSISLRAEAFIGILDDKYRSGLVLQEAHGLSFWLGYHF